MYQGIYNENEFYSDHYLHEVLSQDLEDLFAQWDEREENPAKELASMRAEYLKVLDRYQKCKDGAGRIQAARPFLWKIINLLGYNQSEPWWESDDGHSVLPLFSRFRRNGDSFDSLLVFDLYPDTEQETSLLEERFSEDRYSEDIEAGKKETGRNLEEILSGLIFRQNHPPRWVLILSLEELILVDRSKWGEKRTLRLNLREIYDYKNTEGYRAFCALSLRESLAPGEGESLLDQLNENSHKHAFSVSEDLKFSLREAIELIGNEAVYQIGADTILAMPKGEESLSKECLRYMYRLLFLFYIEARPELGYAPMGDEIYLKGYSLESLRDLAEGPEPVSEEQQKGLYLDRSIKILFKLIAEGTGQSKQLSQRQTGSNLFRMQPLKSHLFDANLTPMLNQVEFPNKILHKVLELMSLSRRKKGKKSRRGRISYVQLGINQLGAVYEGLLSYRGFIAREELFEVKSEKEGNDKSELEAAIFVTREQLAQFNDKEKMTREDGSFKSYPRHSFIYRLTGRDREKSASYYTPEVLTQCLVKYSLKELLKDKTADEILHLTVCEPAMGSAAFLNEAINQLSEEYLTRKQKEIGVTIPHADYTEEKQRVKSYMADRNVFGVDLNPVAVELGEVSLWLNTIFSGGFVPWFGFQLKNGNSLIGARRETLLVSSLLPKANSPWHQLKPERNTNWKQSIPITTAKIFHWLLPDPGMADYTDKVVKELAADGISACKEWRNAQLKPFSDREVDTLRQLTSSADKLWLVWAKHLANLREQTTDYLPVFGQKNEDGNVTSYFFKDSIINNEVMIQGVQNSSEYQRLKLAMDYWCALWFWPLDQTELLPDRKTWLDEMNLLLANGLAEDSRSEGMLFDSQDLGELDFDSLKDEIGQVNVPALIESSPRLQLVEQLSLGYKFFHWELEFADIFAQKGGFDLILGNPPWIKVQWDEKGVLGEKEPLFIVRKLSASKVATLRTQTFDSFPILKEEYLKEYYTSAGFQNFLNANVNFMELKGMKANLYKCFLPLSWRIGQDDGIKSFIHPEGVFDDPRGGHLRREIYLRLRYHFQFQNELSQELFPEVDHHMKFSLNISSKKNNEINFISMANIFNTSAIDTSFIHKGLGPIIGIKDDKGKWNQFGHKSRLIQILEEHLALFAELYDEEGTDALEARFPALHTKELIEVLGKFAAYPKKLKDLKGKYYSTQHWNEVNSQQDGTILRKTQFPESPAQWVVSGPHFYLGNPFYKTPRSKCLLNGDYDNIDLSDLPENYLPRTNFIPDCSSEEFLIRTPKVPWEIHKREDVSAYYRFINREMLNQTQERTLLTTILPLASSHINSCLSIVFREERNLLLFFTASLSLPFDYRVKSTGMGHANISLMKNMPFLMDDNQNNALFTRGLAIVALNEFYSKLWIKNYDSVFQIQTWFKKDPRLSNDFYRNLTPEWNRNCALRTDYTRRQALVEIDVLVAREMGITLEELIAIYRIQFPVLRQNEQDSWYDTRGRIIFTCSKGLTGVGLPRKKRAVDEKNGISYGIYTADRQEEGILLGWEDVKDLQEGDRVSKTWMDDTLPGGPREKTVTYYAPFDCCDREADYREVWGNLENDS